MTGYVTPGRGSTWHKVVSSMGAMALVAALATGCGSSDDSSASGDAGVATAAAPAKADNGAAAKIVADASKPIAAWDGFGAAIEPPAGKHLVAIECSSLGVGCVQGAEAVKEAAGALGWSADVVNGKGDPTVWNSAIQNAVASKADGIVLMAISPALVKDGIAKAKAAGIPVAAALVGPKADALAVTDPQDGAKSMAAYLTEASGGKANILVLNDAEFVLTDIRNKAMASTLGQTCAGCKVKTVEFTFATMPTKLPGQISSALQADPTIDYVVAPFDAAAAFVRQGIQQGGGKAKIASFEGDPPTLKTIGDGVQVADLATPNVWAGWQSVDSIARVLLKQPVSDTPLPTRLFTTDDKGDAVGWDGDFDFKSKYRQLWGKG
jgi:ribose transport system substrate-binding protein